MKTDPEIERIRAVRHRISDECGHDPKRLIQYYRRISQELHASGRYRFVGTDREDAGLVLREEPAGPAA